MNDVLNIGFVRGDILEQVRNQAKNSDHPAFLILHREFKKDGLKELATDEDMLKLDYAFYCAGGPWVSSHSKDHWKLQESDLNKISNFVQRVDAEVENRGEIPEFDAQKQLIENVLAKGKAIFK